MLHNIIERCIEASPQSRILPESRRLTIFNNKFSSIKKDDFILIKPFQKGESLGLTLTWAKVLDCKYFS